MGTKLLITSNAARTSKEPSVVCFEANRQSSSVPNLDAGAGVAYHRPSLSGFSRLRIRVS